MGKPTELARGFTKSWHMRRDKIHRPKPPQISKSYSIALHTLSQDSLKRNRSTNETKQDPVVSRYKDHPSCILCTPRIPKECESTLYTKSLAPKSQSPRTQLDSRRMTSTQGKLPYLCKTSKLAITDILIVQAPCNVKEAIWSAHDAAAEYVNR